MDIVKKKKKPIYTKKPVLLGAFSALFASVLFATTQVELSSASIEKTSIISAPVEQGEFTVTVAGPGILAPRDVRWIASNVDGRVERILLKPGALVSKGELIVELTNPELKQQVDELAWEKQALQAEVDAFKVSQQTQLLDMQATLLQTEMQYEKAKMRLDAEKELMANGNATVSKIDFEGSKLTVSQLAKTIEIDKQRFGQLKQNIAAQMKAKIARIEKLNKSIERAEFQLASLQVKAPVSGILQALPLELGQRVALGSNVAKLAKQDDLIAELNIPELLVSNIALNQTVLIDTRFNTINGKVIRIDPAVINGTVQVDVELSSSLPPEARPDLSIDGEIIIAKKPNTLFVRRPVFSQTNQTLSIYKIDDTGRYAEKTAVSFGIASATEIEILDGLQAGDKVIVSEQREFARHQKVTLN